MCTTTPSQGILLAAEKYDVLMKSVERDCNVLESFGIMDYSLLLGVHNIDHAQQEMAEVGRRKLGRGGGGRSELEGRGGGEDGERMGKGEGGGGGDRI